MNVYQFATALYQVTKHAHYQAHRLAEHRIATNVYQLAMALCQITKHKVEILKFRDS